MSTTTPEDNEIWEEMGLQNKSNAPRACGRTIIESDSDVSGVEIEQTQEEMEDSSDSDDLATEIPFVQSPTCKPWTLDDNLILIKEIRGHPVLYQNRGHFCETKKQAAQAIVKSKKLKRGTNYTAVLAHVNQLLTRIRNI
ncbi:hypothetical protein M3Y96_00405500 [Aphelenchoides besseyi]|nr:hypothetical protein M3Y96_00405500 [Aphelenchoides besseyi]